MITYIDLDRKFFEIILEKAPDRANWRDIHFQAEAALENDPLASTMSSSRRVADLARWLSDRYYAIYRDLGVKSPELLTLDSDIAKLR